MLDSINLSVQLAYTVASTLNKVQILIALIDMHLLRLSATETQSCLVGKIEIEENN